MRGKGEQKEEKKKNGSHEERTIYLIECTIVNECSF